MSRTLKDAAIRRYHHGSHDALRQRLQLFLDACDHARRLKIRRGYSPNGFICTAWTDQPASFTPDPTDDTLGPNI